MNPFTHRARMLKLNPYAGALKKKNEVAAGVSKKHSELKKKKLDATRKAAKAASKDKSKPKAKEEISKFNKILLAP